MTQESIQYLSKQMVNAMSSLKGFGAGDTKVKPDTEGQLREKVVAALSRGDFRVGRTERQGLFGFTGRRYEYIGDDDFAAAMKVALTTLDVGVVYRNASIGKIYNDMRTCAGIEDYVPTKSVVSFRNRMLDLDTMEAMPHSGRVATAIYLDIDYDPRACAPRWERFLHEVLTEEQAIMVLQEFFGCVFVDRSKLHMAEALFLYGQGANGKSVVLEVMKDILGPNMTNASLKSLCTGMHADYHLASIDGALLNFSPDEGAESFSTGIFKNLTDGSPIRVRPIGEKPYDALNMPLMACNLNKIPQTTDTSNGYYRRMLIIPFTRVFKKEEMDRMLNEKLRGELSGIFNWIMEGRKRIIAQEGCFTESAEIRSAKAFARINGSSVLQWLADSGYKPEGSIDAGDLRFRFSAKELRDNYSSYCEDMGYQPKGIKNIREELISEGYAFKTVRPDSDPTGNPVKGFILWKSTVMPQADDADELNLGNDEDDGVPF